MASETAVPLPDNSKCAQLFEGPLGSEDHGELGETRGKYDPGDLLEQESLPNSRLESS